MSKIVEISYDVIMVSDIEYLDYIDGEFDSLKAAQLRADSFNTENAEDIADNECGLAIVRKLEKTWLI